MLPKLQPHFRMLDKNEFLQLYTRDALTLLLQEHLQHSPAQNIRLEGLSGSLDAVLAAASFRLRPSSGLFILEDREQAVYFQNDLQNLLDGVDVMLFPSSYKRAYEYTETENANVLQRAEVIQKLSSAEKPVLVVSYPQALVEKIVNKRSLQSNTFQVRLGDKLDMGFMMEVLESYDFERADLVYEPGQFAIRGGIIDVFSFADEYPYRLELFGSEVDSIRFFDPNTQLSRESLDKMTLMPNIQTRLLMETREPLLDFFPASASVWTRDHELCLDLLEKNFKKVQQRFVEQSPDEKIILKPEALFENAESFEKALARLPVVEFGKRGHRPNSIQLQFHAQPQASFNKNFELLKEDLRAKQEEHYLLVMASEQPRQLDRLASIFEELDPNLKFHSLHLGLREGFVDQNLHLVCYTDHQLFERYHRAKTKDRFSKTKALTLKELQSLQPGDYVTHIDHGIGRFAGMERIEVSGRMQEAIRVVYRDNDLLFVSIHSLHKLARYSGQEGTPPVMSKLGSPEWENKKKKVKKKVKDIAQKLIKLYAQRKQSHGFAFKADGVLQAELESSFMYEDTPDQAQATLDVKQDMEQAYPMDRLVCGDVGFGKTEVAIRAAFKAVTEGKQVAVLVPTTILAMQHYRTFSERLSSFGVDIDYINRFKSTKQIKESLKKLEEGRLDIIIGTHRLVSKDVKFKDLGLLVIDEEQKFGVAVKEKLKEMRINVDVLTLTATPIPRTLHFSLMGARDLSVIQTPPPNRQPVTTRIHTYNEEIIRDAVSKELNRGGQVFFVHNRISDIEQIADIILKLVPDARVGVAHGQMDGAKLEKVMGAFIEGEFDVLVSTNIIESGLDIPNANTIIINRAHMFGLSDVHQMRGRVGRSNKKAYCYLLSPPAASLTQEARKRLRTLEEFSELGDGFKVAMRDLDIRGAGNLLGGEQSGFINDLGFETYHKVLEEAVEELKETEFKDLFKNSLMEAAKKLVKECSIETDLELIIPENYVQNISERLNLYTQLDKIKDDKELDDFKHSLRDRFGPLPEPVQALIETVPLRWQAENMGVEKLSLKSEKMKLYFVDPKNEQYYNSEIFGRILHYVQKHSKSCRLKEYKGQPVLHVADVKTVDQASSILSEIMGKTNVAKTGEL
jgi:transcription-repair coupling factor (superfamily II helicase)